MTLTIQLKQLRYPPRTLSTNREGRLFLMGELSRLPPPPRPFERGLEIRRKRASFRRKLGFLSVLRFFR